MKPTLREAALVAGLALLPAIVQAVYFRDQISWQAPVATSDSVTVAQAQAWGSAALWLDARPDEEFAQEHVPGAMSLNEDRWSELLPRVLETWSPDKRIVVYCSSQACGASREVARRLRTEGGLKNVYVLEGGWQAWIAAKK